MLVGIPFLYVQFCGSPYTLPARTPVAVSVVDAPIAPPPPPPPVPPPPVGCPHRDLGSAQGFNVYALGDFVGQHSNVGGRIAVGGRLSVDGYALGSTLPDDGSPSVVVGGDAEIANSRIHGGSLTVRGRCDTRSMGLGASSRLQCNDPTAFSAAGTADELRALSRWLASQPDRACTVRANEWGAVEIRSLGASAVCTLDLDGISSRFGPSVYNGWLNQVSIDGPPGGTVVINVRGEPTPWGKTGSYPLSGGLRATGVVWNFADASRLAISGVGLAGTVLAPAAAVRFDNGTIEGQLVAASVVGTGQFRDAPFSGSFCR